MAGARFTVYLNDSTLAACDGYAEFKSARVVACMDRYLAVVGQARPRLTVDEWWTLLRALWRERLFTADEVRTFWAKVENLRRENTLAPICDGPALVQKLKLMSMSELMAVADVLERIGLMDADEIKGLSKVRQIEKAGGLIEQAKPKVLAGAGR